MIFEDSSNPFSLHNGDHPGLILVSNPLTGNNYNTWSRLISTALMKGAYTSKGTKSDKVRCSHCHLPNHTVDKCYKLHGYPPGHLKFKLKQNDKRSHMNQIQPLTDSTASGVGDVLKPGHCRQLISLLISELHLGNGTTMAWQ
ncbi:hypothetical protein F511_22883 [Dorcoceras hygrometricum]|uniref:Retrotransposon Copia-like N-terminal domain-containing protein n=1 Tax=Dorcoceras hygrometricum TaxID=472368 RepID=A0A2Z7APM7_9LAMI|nr:hypothetical protein F511_22883 [Dorcoceras hygrometricum]